MSVLFQPPKLRTKRKTGGLGLKNRETKAEVTDKETIYPCSPTNTNHFILKGEQP